MELSISHILYGLFTLAIIITMILRKGIVLPTLLGTFIIAWVYKGSIIDGFTAIFKANLVAAQELFSIFLIITFMLALLHSLRDLGADKRMIQPIQKMMINGHVSFFVLVGITYLISLFFWPTPAVPLICALLVPAAIQSGLPAITAAVAIAIAGQGMALSSDYIVQVAPNLSATSAGVDTAQVADKSLILSLITGFIALGIAYVMYRKMIRKKGDPRNQQELENMQLTQDSSQRDYRLQFWSRLFAILVPLALASVVIYMVYEKLLSGRMTGLEGGDGAAFVGGVAVILLLLSTIAFRKQHALDYITTHITDGFVFAFKAMGPVIPIAGFFFLGSSDFSADIIGVKENPPAFLFDLVQSTQSILPQSALLAALSILIIGIITGLDGSGFSGLPLTGALAASLQNSSIDVTTLAAIGQMGSIWTGGGTLVAWSSLIAIAGFCGVSVMELVRKNFIPVMVGLIVATIVAVFIL
ncbi:MULTISPECIES: membrane protein [Virgibacillus]|uniref:membrane protein n=1 Tax=Virgibacillus TaxID=84406 RepID=UPI0003888B58|nr:MULTISPECIES: membrane protein [Virgibacillus]EQB36611.1 membrane protein [Virgibacillus sp. CM-4]